MSPIIPSFIYAEYFFLKLKFVVTSFLVYFIVCIIFKDLIEKKAD